MEFFLSYFIPQRALKMFFIRHFETLLFVYTVHPVIYEISARYNSMKFYYLNSTRVYNWFLDSWCWHSYICIFGINGRSSSLGSISLGITFKLPPRRFKLNNKYRIKMCSKSLKLCFMLLFVHFICLSFTISVKDKNFKSFNCNLLIHFYHFYSSIQKVRSRKSFIHGTNRCNCEVASKKRSTRKDICVVN